MLKLGDEVDVTVVEVDKERGRIGLRLSEDPEVEGKTAEELTRVGTGDSAAAADAAATAAEGGGGRDGRALTAEPRRARRLAGGPAARRYGTSS